MNAFKSNAESGLSARRHLKIPFTCATDVALIRRNSRLDGREWRTESIDLWVDDLTSLMFMLDRLARAVGFLLRHALGVN